MKSQKAVAAEQIQVRCTKCRKVTAHTAIAASTEHPAQVQCRKCQHVAVAKAPAEPRVIDTQKTNRKEWATLRPEMDSNQAKDYSMTSAYKVKTLINHATFGLGVVRQNSGTQKMVVLFEDGEKVMRCK